MSEHSKWLRNTACNLEIEAAHRFATEGLRAAARLKASWAVEAADYIDAIEAENQRLREALAKYADKMNWWCSTLDDDNDCEHDCDTDSKNCIYDNWACLGTAHGYELAQQALLRRPETRKGER